MGELSIQVVALSEAFFCSLAGCGQVAVCVSLFLFDGAELLLGARARKLRIRVNNSHCRTLFVVSHVGVVCRSASVGTCCNMCHVDHFSGCGAFFIQEVHILVDLLLYFQDLDHCVRK